MGVLEYKGKTEKLKYYDNEEKNEISLIEENNILPLEKFNIKKYFDDKKKRKHRFIIYGKQ